MRRKKRMEGGKQEMERKREGAYIYFIYVYVYVRSKMGLDATAILLTL